MVCEIASYYRNNESFPALLLSMASGYLHMCFFLPFLISHIISRTCLCSAGKTTLADSLVASNGIISQRQAGKVLIMSFIFATSFSNDWAIFLSLVTLP